MYLCISLSAHEPMKQSYLFDARYSICIALIPAPREALADRHSTAAIALCKYNVKYPRARLEQCKCKISRKCIKILSSGAGPPRRTGIAEYNNVLTFETFR